MNNTIRKPGVLVTGANGEMGHGLIEALAEHGSHHIIALDVRPIDEALRPYCGTAIVGDILEQRLLERMQSEYEIHSTFLNSRLNSRAGTASR
jgi:threonine 3-dehydrogenase